MIKKSGLFYNLITNQNKREEHSLKSIYKKYRKEHKLTYYGNFIELSIDGVIHLIMYKEVNKELLNYNSILSDVNELRLDSKQKVFLFTMSNLGKDKNGCSILTNSNTDNIFIIGQNDDLDINGSNELNKTLLEVKTELTGGDVSEMFLKDESFDPPTQKKKRQVLSKDEVDALLAAVGEEEVDEDENRRANPLDLPQKDIDDLIQPKNKEEQKKTTNKEIVKLIAPNLLSEFDSMGYDEREFIELLIPYLVQYIKQKEKNIENDINEPLLIEGGDVGDVEESDLIEEDTLNDIRERLAAQLMKL